MSSIGVVLSNTVGKVSSQSVGFDHSRVESWGTGNDGWGSNNGGGDDSSLSTSDESQKSNDSLKGSNNKHFGI